MTGKFLLIYICNFHVLSHILLIYICKLHWNHSELGALEKLQNDINEVVLNDLDLDRIWPGFGTKVHKTFYGSQLIIGRGSNDSTQVHFLMIYI